MVVICEECGKKYKIDPAKIKGKQARFKCKACGMAIIVQKPVPPPVGQDLAATSPSTASSAVIAPLAEPRGERETEAPAAGKKSSGKKKKKAPKHKALKRFRFGLTPKVVVMMLVISLVPLGVFWGITFKETSDRIRQDTEKLMAQISSGLTSHVDEWIDKNMRVLKALAQMPDVVSMNKARQEPLLKAVQQAYPWMYLVFTVGTDGMNVARNDGKPLKDYSDRQYYKDAMSGKDPAWQTLIGKTAKKPALVMAVPIRRGNRIVGVMANAMKIDDISKRIATWRRGRTGFAFLVDEKAKVVAHQKKAYVQQQKKLPQHPLVAAHKKGKSGTVYFQNGTGERCVGYVKGTKYGWALALQQSENEAFQILKEAKAFALILLGATLVMVFFIAWFSGRTIVRPIRQLTEAADRISVGELDVEIKVKSQDEIGALSQAIIRMQESIRLSIERLRRRR